MKAETGSRTGKESEAAKAVYRCPRRRQRSMESQQLTVMKTDDNSHNEDDDDYSRIVVVTSFAFYPLSLRWLTESLNWETQHLWPQSQLSLSFTRIFPHLPMHLTASAPVPSPHPTPHSVGSPFFLALPSARARYVLETKI